MTTTVDLIISENREFLNREFSELRHFAEYTKSTDIVTSATFFAKMVRQFLGERKFNKTHQSADARYVLACKAARFACRCCTIAHDRAIVNDHRATLARRNGRDL